MQSPILGKVLTFSRSYRLLQSSLWKLSERLCDAADGQNEQPSVTFYLECSIEIMVTKCLILWAGLIRLSIRSSSRRAVSRASSLGSNIWPNRRCRIHGKQRYKGSCRVIVSHRGIKCCDEIRRAMEAIYSVLFPKPMIQHQLCEYRLSSSPSLFSQLDTDNKYVPSMIF